MRFLPTVAAIAASALITSAASALPSASPLHFTVLRDGKPVGTHSLIFQNDAGGLKVTVDTDVVVKFAFVPVYRFEHHGEEIWRKGRLASLSSTTNDDGTSHHLQVSADSANLAVHGDDKTSNLPPSTIPASLWHPGTVEQASLMNTLDGHPMAVTVKDLGEEIVTVRGQSQTAHHYVLSGDLLRDLWYDPEGTLVQVRFQAQDDSEIRYVLQ